MDAMLQYLLVLIYIRMIIVLAILCCAKKQPKVGSSQTKMTVDEPPRRRRFAPFKPRIIALNEKEVLIKGGLKAGQHAYPTLDDIASDWTDTEELKKKREASRESGSRERVLEISALEEKSDDKRPSREVFTQSTARTAMLPMKSDPAKVSIELDKTSEETYKPSDEKIRYRGETPTSTRRTPVRTEESVSITPLGFDDRKKKPEKKKKSDKKKIKKKTAHLLVTAEGKR